MIGDCNARASNTGCTWITNGTVWSWYSMNKNGKNHFCDEILCAFKEIDRIWIRYDLD